MKQYLVLSALVASAFAATPAPLPPSEDPFYNPPSGFESTSPGTILRSRTITPGFLGQAQKNVSGYQLLFRTRSINGSALADVTTIFVPENATTDRFVSFQTAYDSSYENCDPSYTYQYGANQTDAITSAEQILLQAYLQKNLIVSAPDYEGPEEAWTAGHLSGWGVLDSMRAVSNYASTIGLTTSTPKIAGQGYSGGGLATAWAAALQGGYAPELDIVGWAAGGVPANLTGTAVYLDNTTFSGFLPVAIAGLTKDTAYGAALQPFIDEIATPYGLGAFEYANTHCGIDVVAKYPFQSIETTKYQSLGDQIFYQPTIRNILDQNILGPNASETPVSPIFVYHAKPDEIIPYANASAMVNDWCSNGASVDFLTYGAGGHISTEIIGFVDAFKYVMNAFAGNVTKSGCTRTTTLDTVLNPLALGLDLEPLFFQLLDFLTQIGPNDANAKANPAILKTAQF